jgi:hypothetical protein
MAAETTFSQTVLPATELVAVNFVLAIAADVATDPSTLVEGSACRGNNVHLAIVVAQCDGDRAACRGIEQSNPL